jgi:hypothetical protein
VSDDVVKKILDASRLTRIKPARDKREEELEDAKKLAAFDGAIPATKNWEKRCATVNKTLGYIACKDGESARVAYFNLKKNQAKKRND